MQKGKKIKTRTIFKIPSFRFRRLFRSAGNRFSCDAVAKPNKRDTGYLRSSTALLFHEFQCKNAATVRFNASGKDAAANPAESPHNLQFRPVRRVKISPFGKQKASRGLILTPLGMTPRVRGACSQVACCQWAARCPPCKKTALPFSLREGKTFFQSSRLFFNFAFFT